MEEEDGQHDSSFAHMATTANTSQEDASVSQTNVHDTLTSININMGKMANLLEQMCTHTLDANKPLQGERPTGTKRKPTADQEYESERDFDLKAQKTLLLGQKGSDNVASALMMN